MYGCLAEALEACTASANTEAVRAATGAIPSFAVRASRGDFRSVGGHFSLSRIQSVKVSKDAFVYWDARFRRTGFGGSMFQDCITKITKT